MASKKFGHRHRERHMVDAIGWLRAAILGANDGILSTASLILGVSSAAGAHDTVLVAGAAGVIAGALSMAAGEYVSVSSQADLERADLAREALEIETNPIGEERELAGIYVGRGVSPAVASVVARELTEADALGSHARDELGLTDLAAARPGLAAFASAASFAMGGLVPLIAAIVAPAEARSLVVPLVSLLMLAALGAFGARIGRAPAARAILRVTLLGATAMLLSGALGWLLGGQI